MKMLTLNPGKNKNFRCIAKIEGGRDDGAKIYLGDLNSIKGKVKGVSQLNINDEGVMRPVPNIKTREVCYVAGPSGSGKSTWASEYIKLYKKMFPEAYFHLVSRVNDDPVLDKMDPIRIDLNELLEDDVDCLEDMDEYDCILFDDCDTIQDIEVKKAVSALKNDILETGRHKNITCLITSHLINGNDRKDSRTILNECHNLTVFPKAGGAWGINYALKNYIGMPPKKIEEIMDLPSRWVTIGKMAPQYVLHEKGAYLL